MADLFRKLQAREAQASDTWFNQFNAIGGTELKHTRRNAQSRSKLKRIERKRARAKAKALHQKEMRAIWNEMQDEVEDTILASLDDHFDDGDYDCDYEESFLQYPQIDDDYDDYDDYDYYDDNWYDEADYLDDIGFTDRGNYTEPDEPAATIHTTLDWNNTSIGTFERVHFRLLNTPCCNSLLCWVNPRLPNYCPECGGHIYPEIRGGVLVSDDDASLKYKVVLS